MSKTPLVLDLIGCVCLKQRELGSFLSAFVLSLSHGWRAPSMSRRYNYWSTQGPYVIVFLLRCSSWAQSFGYHTPPQMCLLSVLGYACVLERHTVYIPSSTTQIMLSYRSYFVFPLSAVFSRSLRVAKFCFSQQRKMQTYVFLKHMYLFT